MHAAGFANIPTSQRSDDGLTLKDAYIAAAVRCAPPDNKPTPDEIATCHAHLVAEAAALTRLTVIVALGRIAFDASWRLLADRGVGMRPKPSFGHGLTYRPPGGPIVIASYHPSRQNTNTGKLTPPMLEAVFRKAAQLVTANERPLRRGFGEVSRSASRERTRVSHAKRSGADGRERACWGVPPSPRLRRTSPKLQRRRARRSLSE